MKANYFKEIGAGIFCFDKKCGNIYISSFAKFMKQKLMISLIIKLYNFASTLICIKAKLLKRQWPRDHVGHVCHGVHRLLKIMYQKCNKKQILGIWGSILGL